MALLQIVFLLFFTLFFEIVACLRRVVLEHTSDDVVQHPGLDPNVLVWVTVHEVVQMVQHVGAVLFSVKMRISANQGNHEITKEKEKKRKSLMTLFFSSWHSWYLRRKKNGFVVDLSLWEYSSLKFTIVKKEKIGHFLPAKPCEQKTSKWTASVINCPTGLQLHCGRKKGARPVRCFYPKLLLTESQAPMSCRPKEGPGLDPDPGAFACE